MHACVSLFTEAVLNALLDAVFFCFLKKKKHHLKKALSFEAVTLASLEQVQQRPHPERRFGEQREMFEVTKISSKDRILQRTGDQTVEGSGMVEQLEEVERNSVDESLSQIMEESFEEDKIVLLERIPEEVGVHSGVIDVTDTSSQDRNLQRTVERDSVDVDKATPQERIFARVRVVEVPMISCQESVEVVKNIPKERISERSEAIEVPQFPQERIFERNSARLNDVTEFSSQDRSLLRTVDQMLNVTKISPRPELAAYS